MPRRMPTLIECLGVLVFAPIVIFLPGAMLFKSCSSMPHNLDRAMAEVRLVRAELDQVRHHMPSCPPVMTAHCVDLQTKWTQVGPMVSDMSCMLEVASTPVCAKHIKRIAAWSRANR